MRVSLTFVPADGAEVSHNMEVDLEDAPQVGDSILIRRSPTTGYEAFVVKRRWWMLNVSETNPVTNSDDIAHRLVVECHFARCDDMADDHRKACGHYEDRGMAIVELPQLPH